MTTHTRKLVSPNGMLNRHNPPADHTYEGNTVGDKPC